VLPSYHEGFPRTIWEAMANSLPVIATRVGGIPNYLKNNENAILIEPKIVEDIVISVKKLINDNNLREKIVVNGLEIAKQNTLEKSTKNIIKIIEKK
jgi:glycosyltransferase involved in cell wall biosynthesis